MTLGLLSKGRLLFRPDGVASMLHYTKNEGSRQGKGEPSEHREGYESLICLTDGLGFYIRIFRSEQDHVPARDQERKSGSAVVSACDVLIGDPR
jgi:hypothetical protein